MIPGGVFQEEIELRTRNLAVLTLGIVIPLLLSFVPAFGDSSSDAAPTAPAEIAPAAPPAPAPPAEPTPIAVPKPEVPNVTPDTELFRRTPVIDGVIDDGEWDAYYTFTSGDWECTAYADWDSGNLYVGTKSNKPIDILALLDANADGWFHGEENLEFMATRGTGGNLVLTVGRYESRNTKSPVATPVTPEEAALVQMKSSASGGTYMAEMRVPALLVRGLKLAEDRRIGFQIGVKTAVEDNGWIPLAGPGDTKECILVTKKIAALKPLVLGFDLKFARIARGDELIGKFHLTNSGSETIDVRSFVIAGEGKAGDYLNSEKIRIDGLPPKKHIAQGVSSIIPRDMRLGCWAIGAEVRSSDARLGGALVSFEVVDPFEIELRLPPNNVRSDVKDVTFGVVIKNNKRRDIRGKAKITLPIGWELWKNTDMREFTVSGGAVSSVAFKAKPPLGALGDVPVKVEVTVVGETKTAEGTFAVVNPEPSS